MIRTEGVTQAAMDNDTMVAVTPKKYRKTALIEATQWFKDGDHPAVRMVNDVTVAIETGQDVPWVDTLEGGHIVTPGDWIATGVKGEHWPIKPDVFAATYEEVRHQSGRTGAGERETVARVIHQCLRPVNMMNADWDSGAILGADNSWRRSVYSTADHILAALSQSTAGEDGPKWVYDIQWGPEGQQDYAHVYDLGGNLIAVMKTHDAARVAKHRGGDQ